MYKKGIRLLTLLLSLLFLFTGCGGEDKPFEQLCDINTGLDPKLSGLQDSGEHGTRHMLIHDYESFQNTRDELQTKNVVKLPKVKEKKFKNNVYLLVIKTVPQIKDYEYQVKKISADRGALIVQAELVQDPEQGGGEQMCYQVALVRLDKELVQDVQKVSVKTKRVDKTFYESSVFVFY